MAISIRIYISLDHRQSKRSERSEQAYTHPPSIITYGSFLRRRCRGTSFTFFYRTTLFHTIYRLNISSVGGNDTYNSFSVIFYFIIHYHQTPNLILLKDFSILYMMTSWVRMTSYIFNFHTFFMICVFSMISNKIETLFSLSHIYHRSCL